MQGGGWRGVELLLDKAMKEEVGRCQVWRVGGPVNSTDAPFKSKVSPGHMQKLTHLADNTLLPKRLSRNSITCRSVWTVAPSWKQNQRCSPAEKFKPASMSQHSISCPPKNHGFQGKPRHWGVAGTQLHWRVDFWWRTAQTQLHHLGKQLLKNGKMFLTPNDIQCHNFRLKLSLLSHPLFWCPTTIAVVEHGVLSDVQITIRKSQSANLAPVKHMPVEREPAFVTHQQVLVPVIRPESTRSNSECITKAIPVNEVSAQLPPLGILGRGEFLMAPHPWKKKFENSFLTKLTWRGGDSASSLQSWGRC